MSMHPLANIKLLGERYINAEIRHRKSVKDDQNKSPQQNKETVNSLPNSRLGIGNDNNVDL